MPLEDKELYVILERLRYIHKDIRKAHRAIFNRNYASANKYVREADNLLSGLITELTIRLEAE